MTCVAFDEILLETPLLSPRPQDKCGRMGQRQRNGVAVCHEGIKDMDGLPDALFIVDVGHERIAVAEANKLGIPIIGIVDSNNTPDGVDYVIPGNDDAIRSVKLYVQAIADAIIQGNLAGVDADVASEDEFVELNEPNEQEENEKQIMAETENSEAASENSNTSRSRLYVLYCQRI